MILYEQTFVDLPRKSVFSASPHNNTAKQQSIETLP